MSAEVRPSAVVRAVRTVRLVVRVRVSFSDGLVTYYDVEGVSNGEDAVQVARQHAELDRPDVPIFTASPSNVEEREDDQPPEAPA